MSIFEINVVPANTLHEHWPFIGNGLNELCHDYPAFTWIPEDVYASISHGRADLILAKRGERPLGFIVGFVQPIAFTDRKEYFIWVCWGLGMQDRQPEDDAPEYKLKSMNFLRSYSKGLGCCRLHCLVFKRNGDDVPHRAFERLGFSQESASYVLEI